MNAVLWAKKAGIAVELYMLLGSSCEDVKSLQDTKKLLMRLQPLKAVVQNPLVLAPGSSLYEEYLFAHKKKKDFILKQKYPVCYRKNLSARSRVPERKK